MRKEDTFKERRGRNQQTSILEDSVSRMQKNKGEREENGEK